MADSLSAVGAVIDLPPGSVLGRARRGIGNLPAAPSFCPDGVIDPARLPKMSADRRRACRWPRVAHRSRWRPATVASERELLRRDQR